MGKLLEIKPFLDFLKQEGKPDLETADHDEVIEKAFKKMMNKKYSQLPVVKKDKVIGVVSYESVGNTIFSLIENKRSSVSKFKTEDFMERISAVFDKEDDILNLLDRLAEKSYVLVKNGSKITDIITSYDALKFFRICRLDSLLLNGIENKITRTVSDNSGKL